MPPSSSSPTSRTSCRPSSPIKYPALTQILKNLKTENLGSRKWAITACSAKTQEGLEDGLTWLVENVKK